MITQKILFGYLTLLLLFFQNGTLFARVHDYQTTRMKSTAGTGVASLLMNEANLFNPASMGFFQMGAIHLQKDAIEREHEERGETKNDNYSFILTDAKDNVKGSVGYFKYREGEHLRKRLNIAMATNVSEYSTFGLQFRHTKDRDETGSEASERKYHQVNAGVTHVVSPELSVGVLAVDPFRATTFDPKVILGGQYVIKNILALMLDLGTDYKRGLSETFMYRTAVQVQFFSDFYLRAGIFNDKSLGEKGNGAGVSWAGPRLVFDLAFLQTKAFDLTKSLLASKETQKETSLSVSYRF